MEIITNKAFLFNFIGVSGVVLILIAYFFVQTGKLKPSDIRYSLLNLVGATFHLISLIEFWNVASFIIEIFWILIAAYGIVKYLKGKK